MKKHLLASIILIILIGLLTLNQEKVYGIGLENNQEEIIELSQEEKGFFDKMKLKQQYEDEGIMVVDTINGVEKETININGIEYEKDVFIYSIYQASKNGDLDTLLPKLESTMSKEDYSKLSSIHQLAKKYSLTKENIELLFLDNEFVENNKETIKNMIPNKIIVDSRDYKLMTTYYYTTVYVGYYETFNVLWTDTGIYSIQAEYYIQNGNVVYTGGTRYVLNARFCSYDHQDTIEFDYQSFSVVWDGLSTPTANIHLIYDYWGNEKMILSSNDIGEDYKISQNEHYNRNQYNKIGSSFVDILYPNKEDLSGWYDVPQNLRSYFHLLLQENSNNDKFTLGVTYIDLNLGVSLNGELELVYDENGDVEYEDLVTFTFNFGVDESDSENEMVSDSHYIRDVYPYLVWGNSEDDYNNHTAFERFVWDKASFTNNTLARNSQYETLTNMYLNGTITDSGGLEIPNEVQNNAARWDIYFDYITTKTITEDTYSDINWTNQISNEYSSVYGVISKIEVYDNVLYSTPGSYKVKVGIVDAANRVRTQEFTGERLK